MYVTLSSCEPTEGEISSVQAVVSAYSSAWVWMRAGKPIQMAGT